MMGRERIDWENLKPLPRKRKTGATREDLSERRFNMQKAKHKGRCHISNQKRRQIAREKAIVSGKKVAAKVSLFRALKDKVRLYWQGKLDEHP
jgi:hypothetical protein